MTGLERLEFLRENALSVRRIGVHEPRAEWFEAVPDPTLKILTGVVEVGQDLRVSDLVLKLLYLDTKVFVQKQEIECRIVALPSFMKHVRTLETHGLIRTTKTGRVRTCVLNRERFGILDDWLAEQRRIWEERTDRLEQFVTDQEDSTP